MSAMCQDLASSRPDAANTTFQEFALAIGRDQRKVVLR